MLPKATEHFVRREVRRKFEAATDQYDEFSASRLRNGKYVIF